MGADFHLDMPTLMVARIISVVVFALGVSVMTLERRRLETQLFCLGLLFAILSWVTLISAAATRNPYVIIAYVGFISGTVTLQWAAFVVLIKRKVHPAWFMIPPIAAMAGVAVLELGSADATLFSAYVLMFQLAMASVSIVFNNNAAVRWRTAFLMALGYALSFASAAARVLGAAYWPELLTDPIAPVPANTLPFMLSYLGTILITLSWLAALKDRAEAALSHQAMSDELTGLANRRHLRETGSKLWRRSRRQGTLFTMIVLDIDHFKSVNDRWGHDEGDRVLAELAASMLRLRPTPAISARMGGEEFCLVLLGVDAQAAHGISEQLREIVAQNLILPDGLPVRFSAGIAQSGDTDDSIETVYHRADKALYQAKASGRDCAIINQPGSSIAA